MPETEIVAACGFALKAAQRSAPPVYRSAEEMLDRGLLDFVSIAIPTSGHLFRQTTLHGIDVPCAARD